ncbi:transcriptional regulator [Stenotrophomonas panacihumi]|uniref:Transcriptional regulator n=1 Tax=Stenotrophomonas panacihumi TaxID=676599 RepID=A0A0R0ANG9_9GAMM|nr:response regulator [Stenotrophomonas panacihumi]KRG46780.1 transcriptional regulator [Stenotrophomonas panacihumi]PTN54662.1 hybrid sensor histidine kinase/response regulator [Stenotrophomonas panacihumi]
MASREPPRPRVLLVEDDPISLGFFQAALEPLALRLDSADSLAAALERSRDVRHDLWLIDAHLPDGSGSELLARLRTLHPGTPAVAHTADAGATARLLADGFLDVLIKPLPALELQQQVRRRLPTRAGSEAMGTIVIQRDWDEDAALAALNGQQHHLNALRELFLSELPGTRDAVDSALRQDDEPTLRNHLHRLQASCGFVGAARLAQAVRELRGDPHSPIARHHFHDAVAALLH